MGRDEQAIMCVLMLRGPQTPGELKQRADRLHGFPDLGAVGATLDRLIDRNLVARLGRRTGQKEERYRELLGEDAEAGVDAGGERVRAREPEPGPGPDPPDVARREDRVAGSGLRPVAMPGPGPPALTALEERVGRLERAVAELRDEDRVGRLEREVAALREALGG
jgi:uncharacterized protein YceH (UPF0502 family)